MRDKFLTRSSNNVMVDYNVFMKFFVKIFTIILFLGSLQGQSYSEELPLWELGVGGLGLNMPDYRGSDERNYHFVPMPFFIYRGDRFRIDRKGAYGDLFKSDRIKLDISLSAGLPVKSDDNDARNGMPDLDPIIGIGPSLEIQLYSSNKKRSVLSFRTSARSILATDLSHITHEGWVFNPYINYNVRNTGSYGSWNIGVLLGALFATERYHDYYYEVKPEHTTTFRPTYNAKAGYSGSRIAIAARKRFGRLWIGTFGLYDNLKGTTFANSPLVKTDHSFMAGLGIAWIFAKSKTKVPERLF